MSFHTVELHKQLDSPTFWSLQKALNKVTSKTTASIYQIGKNAYRFTLFDAHGVKVTLKSRYCDYHKDEICIVINPQRLKDANEFLKITSGSEYTLISKLFTKLLKPIKEVFQKRRKNKHLRFDFDLLHTYQVRRIDLAVNINTEFKVYYIELIKRANVPNGFVLGGKQDEKGHRWKPYDDSFYLKGNSVNFQIYDKESQLSRQHDNYSRIEDAKNLIRVEVQCLKNKTDYMKISNDWDSKSLVNFVDKERSLKTIKFYYNKFIGLGDYFTLAGAKAQVRGNAKLTDKTKEQLVAFLELINERRGIWKAREDYEGNDFDKLIQRLNKIGINPVTIPVQWKIPYCYC
ncbi:hypothetical protein N0M98_08610 [Paenibacillus doosanensis]|uniref:hypothetical protein n=1 Tax=Paenibacillus doosanensis TaxID=1229154 RepID=UPI00218058FD|nr:hypothetical protein [Paenibacillus doosanensis]MCS7460201.1 hypothetical protein [Paenibacillus doosanensis]